MPKAKPKNAAGPSEEMKARFREALDRKQSHDSVSADGEGGESGKVSGSHGPAKQQQMFRRKAGG